MRAIRLITASFVATVAAARAEIVELEPVRDNTIYSEDSNLSNGSGQHFFCGRAGTGGLRRGLLQFDLSGALPGGATIQRVALTLNLSQTSTGPSGAALHRVLESWGEGASDAAGGEGAGAPAAPGDATWRHRFYDQQVWTTESGTFVATPSDIQIVSGLSQYVWSSAEMADDVRAWLASPEENWGWILIGDESGAGSAKRFDSRQNPTPTARPRLTVEFTPACPGDINGDRVVELADLSLLLAAFGASPDQCQPPCPEDLDGDGDVDLGDLAVLLAQFGVACG